MRHTRALIQQGTTARTTNILLGQMNAEAVAMGIEGNRGTPTPEPFVLAFWPCLVIEWDLFSHHAFCGPLPHFQRGAIHRRPNFRAPILPDPLDSELANQHEIGL
jgi:hypothetical protein